MIERAVERLWGYIPEQRAVKVDSSSDLWTVDHWAVSLSATVRSKFAGR